MLMFERIKSRLFPVSDDVIIAYQYKMPHSISVEIKKTEDGYIARVDKINDEPMSDTTFMVEAKNESQLVNEINDMLLIYLDFPYNVKERMPKLLPPELAMKQGKVVFAK